MAASFADGMGRISTGQTRRAASVMDKDYVTWLMVLPPANGQAIAGDLIRRIESKWKTLGTLSFRPMRL